MKWVAVCQASELGDDPLGVRAEARDIVLYKVDGAVFATEAQCTHGNASLCDGYLEGHEIECPLHQGRFDIRTGKALCEPLTSDLKTFPVTLLDGRITVGIADSQDGL